MNYLLVLNYLNSGKSFDDLKEEHAIDVSNETNGKFSLNYNQIYSRNDDVLAQQCRGLIISKNENGYYPVAVPFFRFFNYGQKEAVLSKEEILNSTIYEKLDGTLAIVYFDHNQNKWCMATRSVPEADLKYNDFTFFELFKKSIDFDALTSQLEKHITYMFELMTPYNMVVVRHENFSVSLIGARDIVTGKELNIDDIDVSVPKVSKMKFESWTDLEDYLNNLPPSSGEGFVVCDSNFNRVKIKSINYVNAHHLVSNACSSKRNMFKAILLGVDDDLEAIVPKVIWNDIQDLKQKFISFERKVNSIYSDLNFSNQKDFALFVTKNHPDISSFLFQLRSGKSFSDIINKQKEKDFPNSWIDAILEVL